MEKECLSERMNCFTHDNDHWRTPPLWTSGPFCFCMNANNNTYSCVRTINSTHNFLYCEFVTGLITFYNLRLGELFLKPFLCEGTSQILISTVICCFHLPIFTVCADPFEQWNRVHTLNSSELSFLRDQLAQLKSCKGSRQCSVGSGAFIGSPSSSSVNAPVAAPSLSRSNIPSLAAGSTKTKCKEPPGNLCLNLS